MELLLFLAIFCLGFAGLAALADALQGTKTERWAEWVFRLGNRRAR